MTVTGAPSRRGIAALPYTAYAWTTFTVCVLPAILGAALLPGLQRRRRWVSACARGFFRLAGIAVSVRGTGRLPDGHAVVVANHASYLDGVILQAYLPPKFSYVIKREMHSVPLGGLLLRRIGSRFVDRNRASASARDARSLVRAAANGEALAFFPEGTFRREAGLGRFRGGAFVTAVKAAA
ncbi:MAG: lysophospholipid acyltransferase family protein, partial [Woeseiaceae bacterium]|nr:lysophospholipid acyltransferase family protein [Woeseiaceae bacterium]